jgi:hypothetical protein
VTRCGVGEPPVAELLGDLVAFLFDDPHFDVADLFTPLVALGVISAANAAPHTAYFLYSLFIPPPCPFPSL